MADLSGLVGKGIHSEMNVIDLMFKVLVVLNDLHAVDSWQQGLAQIVL